MIGTLEEQIKIEEEAQEESITKYINSFYSDLHKGNIADTAEGQVFIRLGFDRVTKKIQEYIDTKTTGTRQRDKAEMLNLSDDPRVLAFITLSSILSMVVRKDNRAPLTTVANSIMSKLYSEFGVAYLRENDPKMFKYMDTQYRRASKKRKAELMKTHVENIRLKVEGASVKGIKLNSADDIRIGSTLIDCVLNSGAGLFAKGKVYNRNRGRGYTYVVYMTESGKDVLKTSHAEAIRRLRFTPQPMIVPPLPWTNNYDGGLITKREPIMKMKTPAGVKELQRNRIPKVYPILNKLQTTKWRINDFVLDTIDYIFENNLVDPRSPRKLPRLYGSLPTYDIVSAKDIIRKENYGYMNEDGDLAPKDFLRWRRDVEATTIALDGEMGRRIQLISALGIAKKYRDYEELYFSYTLDSRGRVYTQQSVITPQGSAEVKAMLEFADGQILNERGEYWFKIHIANVFGMDKEDFDERIKWFTANTDLIQRVGTDPLENLKDWAYCDSPFEFLAACHAWVGHTKGLPVHVPIQLDATNSGVQIYSGLLGDLEGAKTVNVVNVGYRADVYGIVAEKVNKSLYSENYPKIFEVVTSDGKLKTQSTYAEANSIKGKITRSIVKRNVMTVPYSVSRRGMSDQLWDIMDDARLNEKEWWDGDPWVVNKLLTDLNHECIYDTIPGARLGQDYLVALANLCNDKDGMIYHTPIYEIPVVQKKPRVTTNTVQTVLGTLNIRNFIPNSLDKIAQKNGSAPNYIHSIDSTLLLRVIETMSTQIGVIHDCFISHANDGDEVQLRFKESYIVIMKMKPLELIGKQLDLMEQSKYHTSEH